MTKKVRQYPGRPLDPPNYGHTIISLVGPQIVPIPTNLRVISIADDLHRVLDAGFFVNTAANCAEGTSTNHRLVQRVVS